MRYFRPFAVLFGLVVLFGVIYVLPTGTVQAFEPFPIPHKPDYSKPLFPSGSYDLKVGSSTVTAQFAYSLPIPLHMDVGYLNYEGPYDWTFDPQLGQAHKGIYFFAESAPGPAGAFDITDPMNIPAPSIVEWTFGSQHGGHGPLLGFNWVHDARYHGSDVAEDRNGSARLWSYLGSPSYSKVITTFDGGSGSIGDMIDDTETGFGWTGGGGFTDPTRSWTNGHGGTVTAMVSPVDGKFFLYTNSENHPVTIFDVSDLPGSVNPPRYVNNINQSAPNLKNSGTIGWTGVTELEVIPSPDKSKYFLFGRVPKLAANPSCADGSTPGFNGICPGSQYIYHSEGAPTIRIGEISPSTGKLVRQASVAISDVKQKEYPPMMNSIMYYPPMSNIQWAIVNGATYVFAIDDIPFVRESLFLVPHSKGIKIGVYKFNPTGMTLTRVTQITVPDVVGQEYGSEVPTVQPHRYAVIGAENGKAFPLLAVPADQARRVDFSDSAELRFYGLKNVFSTSPPTAMTFSAPDFVVKPKGQHAKEGEEVLNVVPYVGFIRTESGKNNLYLFRNVFQADFDATGNTDFPNSFIAYYDMRYGGGLRTDKIDVSSVTGGSTVTTTTPTTPIGGGTPLTGTPIGTPPPPQTDNKCIKDFRNLCDQVQELQTRLCKLVPTLAFCRGGGGGGSPGPIQNAL
jgi:hypothetical protein